MALQVSAFNLKFKQILETRTKKMSVTGQVYQECLHEKKQQHKKLIEEYYNKVLNKEHGE